MTDENNPAIAAMQAATDEGLREKEVAPKQEETNPSYWRLFYDIQASLIKDGCDNITYKSHNLAKTLYKKWKEA